MNVTLPSSACRGAPHLLAIGALYMTSLALATGLDFDFGRSERRAMAVSTSSEIDPTGEELLDQVALLRTCALFLRADNPEGVAASSIGELAARYGSFRRADLSAFICERQNLKYFAHFEARDSLGVPMGSRLSYAGIPDRSGRPTDFDIVARPLVYGENGIRSYYVRSDGPIHVTLADRAATTSDAVVPACEYGEKWSTLPRYRSTAGCARMPSARPPAVALVHDTVATAGQSFTVAIRDAADRSRPADPTYEHVLWCRTQPGPLLTPRRSYDVFQQRSELTCKVDLDARVALFVDTMRVVVYTRDRSGAIGRVESVVRIIAPRPSASGT